MKDEATVPLYNDMVLALPIEGESFILRREGKYVLVDGGFKKDRIDRVLKRYVPQKDYLDVVVCTHGDRDHVGGLPALLDEWVGRVGQLWLPGRWVNVVPQLARDPDGFFEQLTHELISESKEASIQVLSVILDEDESEVQQGDLRDKSLLNRSDNIEPDLEWPYGFDHSFSAEGIPTEPEWFDALRRGQRELAKDDVASRAYHSARRKVRRWRKQQPSKLRTRIALYWLDLMETAKAIRDLAIAAIRHGIPTRWFDFKKYEDTRRASGGVRNFLVPINAVEQATPPTKLAKFLHLTNINRESLVFVAPPTRKRLGVLFCADSPLGDGPKFGRSFLPTMPPAMQRLPMVATAPHHGAESNSPAYTHLKDWSNIEVILRAGGSKKQPGPTFLNQHQYSLLCTKCPKAKQGPIPSGVAMKNPNSQLHLFGRHCRCDPSSKI
ncbi:MBL fold metallo-hydrolase [Ruegeria lacuscaerulensis]|uniref:MBL fold metallo-hydrolase n=1 Tax=Ruegeria lacuscaerulensis TaxID=55218 RepID=UPI00147C4B2A|nr:MBL fold metallo-hydrolase [Ruegeria lacuscaerulensis]